MSPPDLCPTDRLVIYILGKHGKISGSRIYDELKREGGEILDLVPKHPSSIYRSIKKLLSLGYIEERERKQKRGTVEVNVGLTSKGMEKFHNIKLLLPKGEIFWYIPHFDEFQCEHCQKEEIEECWERYFQELDRILTTRIKRKHLYDKNTLKTHMLYPRVLLELTYWLRMQEIPKKILEEKFKDTLSILQIGC